jgi:transposase
MERRRFTREFKVEAVKLVRERGVAVKQAARDLNEEGKHLFFASAHRSTVLALSLFLASHAPSLIAFQCVFGLLVGASCAAIFGRGRPPAAWIYDALSSYAWLYIGSWAIGLGAFLMAMSFRPFANRKPRPGRRRREQGARVSGAATWDRNEMVMLT